jgi:hypothetical protein
MINKLIPFQFGDKVSDFQRKCHKIAAQQNQKPIQTQYFVWFLRKSMKEKQQF